MEMPRKIAIMLVLTTTVAVGGWLLTVGARGPAADADPPAPGGPPGHAGNAPNAMPPLDAGAGGSFEEQDDEEDDDAYEERGRHDDDDGDELEHEAGYD